MKLPAVRAQSQQTNSKQASFVTLKPLSTCCAVLSIKTNSMPGALLSGTQYLKACVTIGKRALHKAMVCVQGFSKFESLCSIGMSFKMHMDIKQPAL